jgi:hypothetical protein
METQNTALAFLQPYNGREKEERERGGLMRYFVQMGTKKTMWIWRRRKSPSLTDVALDFGPGLADSPQLQKKVQGGN